MDVLARLHHRQCTAVLLSARPSRCRHATCRSATPSVDHDPPCHHRPTLLCHATASTTHLQQAGEAFTELMQQHGVQDDAVVARPGPHQLGIHTTRPAAPGDALLTVPLSLCLYVNYQGDGLQLPVGTWPRLRQAIAKDDAMNWDLLMAVALLDGLSGEGGAFWDAYSNMVLPPPAALTHPLALPKAMLLELQHSLIIDAAMEQKQRLKTMFPGFSTPMEGECGPTFIEWAAACVRSRALQLGPQAFALVPFIDVANHDHERPNADFKVEGEQVTLVATRRMAPGDEVTISYTGQAGATNQRMMAQYGFVPEDGNPADRFPFDLPALTRNVPQDPRGGEASDTSRSMDGPDEGPVAEGLSLQYMQDCLGDAICMDMLSGRNPYLFAALKSLPLLSEGADLYAAHAAAHEGVATRTPLDEAARQQLEATKRAARLLLLQATLELQGFPTTLENDLQRMWGTKDVRMQTLVRYRYERKKLLSAAESLLAVYAGKKTLV